MQPTGPYLGVFLVVLGLDSTFTDASLEPKAFRRKPLNVIGIISPENHLAVPFNFLSCQTFPGAIKLLCRHGLLASMRALPSSPNDIIPESPWGFLRVSDSIPRANSSTPM